MNIAEIAGRQNSINLYFSGKCNMDCAYCYIPKSSKLDTINNDIIKAIEDGSYVETMMPVCSRDLESVNLWGAEPTINSKYTEKLFGDIFDRFKKVNLGYFSTNALLGEKPLLEIAHGIDNVLNRVDEPGKFTLRIQMSLDGPAWITDNNRHAHATHTIIQTYKALIDDFANNSGEYKNLKRVDIQFKPTLNSDVIQKMNNNYKLIEEWFLFFEELYSYYAEIPKDKRGILARVPLIYPTTVTPGFHTSKDGKEYAKFIRLANNLPEETRQKFKHYKSKHLFLQPMDVLERHILSNHTIVQDPHILTCGGGDGSFGIDHKGLVYPCHRLFGINNYYENKGAIQSISRQMSADSNSDLEKIRLVYTMRGEHDFPSMRYAYITAAVKSLAMVGQADEIYLKNDNMCTLLAIAINGLYCSAGIVEETTSIHLITTSLIKLYANGALQELLKIMKERWSL